MAYATGIQQVKWAPYQNYDWDFCEQNGVVFVRMNKIHIARCRHFDRYSQARTLHHKRHPLMKFVCPKYPSKVVHIKLTNL